MHPETFEPKGGSCTKGYPGYRIRILDDEGQEIKERKVMGHVVVELPTPPSFMLTLWNHDELFKEKYFNRFEGYYQTGDGGYFDADGYLHIVSRTDDVINVAGHRLSTSEIEEAIMKHESIVEVAVIGLNDKLRGQIPYGVGVIQKGEVKDNDEIVREVIKLVRESIGPVAFFKNMRIVEKLPKTRSGKILRRTIKNILNHQPWKYPPTIDDPSSLEGIKAIASKVNGDQNKFTEDEVSDSIKKKIKLD